jgi:hypothetical protein
MNILDRFPDILRIEVVHKRFVDNFFITRVIFPIVDESNGSC